MRLSSVLSKPPSDNPKEIDGFLDGKKLAKGKTRKVSIGNVTLAFFCKGRIQVVSATPPVLDKKARCGNTLALYPPQMRELCTTRTLPRKNAITFSVV